MRHWTLIRTIAELEDFQIEFRALSADEKEVITLEMIALIHEYQNKVTINGEKPRQVEKERLYKRKRGARRPRRGKLLPHLGADELDL